jgi:hypothetical protein
MPSLAIEPAISASSTRFWIPLGAALFIVALMVSAIVVPQLRLLHFLQALIYLAVVILARHNSMWAFGAGVTVAIVWNGLQLFVSHLVQAGAVVFWHFVSTGQVSRLDTMMVPLGCIGHFILIFACLVAAVENRSAARKWWRFAGGGAIALAYFALIVAVALPR